MRPIQVEISEQDIDMLAQRGYELQRDDPVSIRHAIEAFLSDLVLDRGGFDLLDADDDQRRCSVAENQVMRKCWRINPDQALDYQVERLARRESRSVSNMLFVLLTTVAGVYEITSLNSTYADA